MRAPLGPTAVITYAAIATAGALVAASGDAFYTQVAIGIGITAIVALSWDIVGRTGQVSLGQGAFFGLGAYGSAILGRNLPMVAAWAGALAVCAAAALLVGLVTLRLKGMYFAIATLGLTLSLQVAVLVWPGWTGGAAGIAPTVLADGEPGRQLAVITGFLVVAAFVSNVFLVPTIRSASFLIRDVPSVAAASGVPIVRYKVTAFVVAGVLAGLAGASYGALYGYIVPTDVFTLTWSVIPLAVVILGGADTTIGPIVGATSLRLLEEVSRDRFGGTGYQLIYGAAITLCIVLLPRGIVGQLNAWRRSRRRARRSRQGGDRDRTSVAGGRLSGLRRLEGAEPGVG